MRGARYHRGVDGAVLRFRVPPEAIAYVRMVVEAYDGLAVVVSPEANVGIVEWWVAPGREAEADALAAALSHEVGLTRIDSGTVSGNWDSPALPAPAPRES